MVLLVAAGLMIKSFARIMQTDPGFNAEHTLTANFTLPDTRYRTEPEIKAAIRNIAQSLQTIPGVTASGLISTPPLHTGWTNTFLLRGRSEIRPNPHGYIALATPGYAAAMQIALKRGRFIEDSDTADSAPIAVIDENAARMYWRNEDPIGKELLVTGEGTKDKPVWRRIVGIMGSVKHRSAMEDETKGQIYIPYQQLPMAAATIVVRAAGNPTVLTSAIRNHVLQVDSTLPIYEVKTMASMYGEFVAQPRFNMLLLGVFAGLALLLAAGGIYAVMSYSVTQLTHEIGIRMALGARQADVLRMVLKQAAKMAFVGLGIGLIGALLATRVLQSLLFGVRAYDIGTFATISVLLSGVAMLASFLPARRATEVDPMIALRSE
jgi:putative ABC transport system permease protein